MDGHFLILNVFYLSETISLVSLAYFFTKNIKIKNFNVFIKIFQDILLKGVDLFMSKGYIGTTRYVPSASRLTDDYGYNGDIAYVIDEANRKIDE